MLIIIHAKHAFLILVYDAADENATFPGNNICNRWALHFSKMFFWMWCKWEYKEKTNALYWVKLMVCLKKMLV